MQIIGHVVLDPQIDCTHKMADPTQKADDFLYTTFVTGILRQKRGIHPTEHSTATESVIYITIPSIEHHVCEL